MKATVVLEAGREKSLLRKHPWVFASAIRNHGGKLHSGDTVDIHAADGRWLARGAYSPASTIRVRAWTFDKDEVIDNGFFLRRIESASRARQLMRIDSNAYRLVAAESDGLPGVTIDRYADVLVCQLLSAGAERHRDKIVWALRKLFPDCAILERSDVQIREKEGLPLLTQPLHGDVPASVTIREAGHQFDVDLMQGHKTGFYLDQRGNRARIAAYAQGRSVLNCFSYTGSIAVYCLAAGAASVTNLDSSEAMLAQAAQHVAMNGLDADRAAHVTADVFAELRKYRAEGRRFDLIVLDPPKFVESKQHLTQACRGYKDINLLALQLLNQDGILATFSCSGLMPEELFHKVVADAALDAGRTVQYLEKLAQDRDHPVLSAYPEGFYLKGLICRVE
ncbi:MAG: class I SAM-dependent rRNA methyltransferase [Gammaproteobacteria bacterium]